MRLALTWLAPIVVFATASVALAADGRVDDLGRLERLPLGKGWVRVNTDVRLVSKGWGRMPTLSTATDLRSTTSGNSRTFTGTLSLPGGAAVQIEQKVREEAGKMVLEIKATGSADGDVEGVLLWVNLPPELLAGGTLTAAATQPAGQQPTPLPATLPADIHLWAGTTPLLRFAAPGGKQEIRIETAPAARLAVQDGRKWTNDLTTLLYVHDGALPKGQTATLTITLSGGGEVDQAPVTFTLDPATVRYRLTGIGGNYCFSLESPVTRYTLDNLKVAAARTEISLQFWAPQPPPSPEAAAGDVPWAPFAAADQPGARLRRELEMMRELTRKGIPFTASVWRVPGWMMELLPSADPNRKRYRITDAQWPGVLRCLGAYLLYAKEQYQAEPDYFSFNESNLGVDVLQTPEEHRAGIKRLGAEFARLGLKTKCLLGDVAGARKTVPFVQPAVDDPEALRYVGAIAIHSWDNPQPEHYAAWADLAAKLQKPLIVAEAGVDAGAWRKGSYRTFAYAVREMTHYQEMLLHARPASVLLWEFTGDYSLLATERTREPAALTERFCLQKHWCDLTPAGSEALACRAEGTGVLATAFRSAGPPAQYTLHLANPNWERPVTVRGLPADVQTLQVVRTARGEFFHQLEALPVRNGAVTLILPGESLTSLTTLAVPGVRPMTTGGR